MKRTGAPARILLFSASPSSPTRGGVTTITEDMAEALKALGEEIEVAFVGKAKCLKMFFEPVSRFGVRGFCLKSFRTYYIGWNTWNWGRAWRSYLSGFDAAVVVSGTPYIAKPFLRSNVPLFVWSATTMDGDLEGRYEQWGRFRRLAYRLCLPRIRRQERDIILEADHVWAVSEQTCRDFMRIVGGRAKNVSVLEPPIDTDYFCPASESCNEPTIIFTGRYNDGRKALGVLLRAFALVKKEVAGARLVLAGERRPSESILAIVHDLGIPEATSFIRELPDRKDLKEYYQRSQVFAMSSRQEGLGISALEAMACGVPAVSTRCGGPETFLDDGVNGFLVPIGDADALARRIVQLLRDPSLRQSLGSKARETILQKFSIATFRNTVREVITPQIKEGRV